MAGNSHDSNTDPRIGALLGYLSDLAQAGVQQVPYAPVEMRAAEPASPPAKTLTAQVRPPLRAPVETAPAAAHEGASAAVEARDPTTDGERTGALAREHDGMTASTAGTRKQRENQLYVLSQEVAQCHRCQELASQRTRTVFGVGNPEARLCFLGEGPGADEDAQGEPFVGRAGQLLDRIITACTLRREDVYILNVVKCRPPGNRNPKPDEVAHCRPFFERQLEIIRPEFICCLGSVAASALLETTDTIGRLRGRFHTWRFAKVLATYHPAYLLRNPPAKVEVWKDMQMLMREMGITLPAN